MKGSFGRFLHTAIACSLLFFMVARGDVMPYVTQTTATPIVAAAENSSYNPESEQQLKWSLVGGGTALIVVGLVGVISVTWYRKKGRDTKDLQENNKKTITK